MHRIGRKLTTTGLVAVVALAGLFIVLRHPGGPLTIVSTYGASMQPTLEQHTLVVIRGVRGYEVGDIAAYRSHQLNTVVLHRIVEIDGDRYTFKGDGNDWLDPEQPTRDQIIGTAWLAFPSVGRLTRIPPLALGAALLAGVLLLGGRIVRPAARDKQDARGLVSSPTLLGLAIRTTMPAAIVLGAAVTLGVVAFAQPATGPGTVSYTQQGDFSYSGEATTGLVYPDGSLTTGAPIYLSLVDELDVTFSYILLTAADHDLQGRAELIVTVSDTSGWEQTLPGSRSIDLDGPDAEVTVTIDPREVHALFDRLAQETGDSTASRRITVQVEVELAGEVAQTPVENTFTPHLGFVLDEQQLRLAGDELHISEPGTVTVANTEARALEAVGISLDVAHARTAAIAVGLAALLVLLAAAVVRRRYRQTDETTRIKARFGDLVIDVADIRPPDERTIVEVNSIDILAVLTEAAATPIMHRRWGTSDTFFIDNGSTVYWYEARGQLGAPEDGVKESEDGAPDPSCDLPDDINPQPAAPQASL